MSDEQEGIRDRIRSTSGQVASDLAGAVISSPVFGQAVSAAAAAREKAIEAQTAARGLLDLSSQEDTDRLERRIRVLSDRLEETEDRLDEALGELRQLRQRPKAEVDGEGSAGKGSGKAGTSAAK